MIPPQEQKRPDPTASSRIDAMPVLFFLLLVIGALATMADPYVGVALLIAAVLTGALVLLRSRVRRQPPGLD